MMFDNLFKPITITIPREEYNELKAFQELFKAPEKRIRRVYSQSSYNKLLDQLKEKQEYCDYLELESNNTEARLKQELKTKTDTEALRADLQVQKDIVKTLINGDIYYLRLDLEDTKKCLHHANKVNKANIVFMDNLRAENDRLGEELKEFQEQLDNSFEARLSRGLQAMSNFAQSVSNDLPKPIITEGKDENGEYTDKTYILAKICTKCNQQKPLDQFHKQVGKKGGVRSECKECRRLESKAGKQIGDKDKNVGTQVTQLAKMINHFAPKPIAKIRSLQDHADNISSMTPKFKL